MVLNDFTFSARSTLSFSIGNPKAYWKRPERWLAFFLTFLAVCSFLAMVPVTPELSPDVGLATTGSESELSFIEGGGSKEAS